MVFCIVDSRRPLGLDLYSSLRFEAFVDNAKVLLRRISILARSGCQPPINGIATPSASRDGVLELLPKAPTVRDLDRLVAPITASHQSAAAMSPSTERASEHKEKSLDWSFLIEAVRSLARTAPIVLEQPAAWTSEDNAEKSAFQVLILTTDLLLWNTESELCGATTFFQALTMLAIAVAASNSVVRRLSISFVMTSLGGRTGPSVADSFGAWEHLRAEARRAQERDSENVTSFDIQVIDNNEGAFDALLRAMQRQAAAKVRAQLHLPTTSAFRGSIEVELTPYLAAHGNGKTHRPLHAGLSELHIAQAVPLSSLDVGLIQGAPLACHAPEGGRQAAPNRALLRGLCLELAARDLGLLFIVDNAGTTLKESWLLVAEETEDLTGLAKERRDPHALLLRLATAEEVLENVFEEGEDDPESSENDGAMERAAASATLDALRASPYDPLAHFSGYFRFKPPQGAPTHANVSEPPRPAKRLAGTRGWQPPRQKQVQPPQQQQQQQQQVQQHVQPAAAAAAKGAAATRVVQLSYPRSASSARSGSGRAQGDANGGQAKPRRANGPPGPASNGKNSGSGGGSSKRGGPAPNL